MKNLLIKAYKDKSLSIELLRFYLGVALFLKGIYFITHMKDIFDIVSYRFPYLDFLLAHYVVVAHIAGGVCIAVGLFTRVAAFLNIPVLVSAIIFVQGKNGVFKTGSEFELAFMVLALLIFVIWQGSGNISMDHYIHWSHEDHLKNEKEWKNQTH